MISEHDLRYLLKNMDLIIIYGEEECTYFLVEENLTNEQKIATQEGILIEYDGIDEARRLDCLSGEYSMFWINASSIRKKSALIKKGILVD